MIHIGSADFYAQVRLRLGGCDQILFEGVRSVRGWILTLSYRLVVRRKRLGLVLQNPALSLKDIGPQLVRADVTAEEFAADWDRIPWHWLIAIAVSAPAFGVYRYFTATRESIGKRMSTEDVKSRDDLVFQETQPALQAAILDRRDARLIAALEAVLTTADSPRNVGVLYGAGHMSSVTDWLMSKRGFRVLQAEWLTVFEYADV